MVWPPIIYDNAVNLIKIRNERNTATIAKNNKENFTELMKKNEELTQKFKVLADKRVAIKKAIHLEWL